MLIAQFPAKRFVATLLLYGQLLMNFSCFTHKYRVEQIPSNTCNATTPASTLLPLPPRKDEEKSLHNSPSNASTIQSEIPPHKRILPVTSFKNLVLRNQLIKGNRQLQSGGTDTRLLLFPLAKTRLIYLTPKISSYSIATKSTPSLPIPSHYATTYNPNLGYIPTTRPQSRLSYKTITSNSNTAPSPLGWKVAAFFPKTTPKKEIVAKYAPTGLVKEIRANHYQYQLTFQYTHNQWEATLVDVTHPGFTSSFRLPIYFGGGYTLDKLAMDSTAVQQKRIYLQNKQGTNTPELLYIGKVGLLGGGKEDEQDSGTASSSRDTPPADSTNYICIHGKWYHINEPCPNPWPGLEGKSLNLYTDLPVFQFRGNGKHVWKQPHEITAHTEVDYPSINQDELYEAESDLSLQEEEASPKPTITPLGVHQWQIFTPQHATVTPSIAQALDNYLGAFPPNAQAAITNAGIPAIIKEKLSTAPLTVQQEVVQYMATLGPLYATVLKNNKPDQWTYHLLYNSIRRSPFAELTTEGRTEAERDEKEKYLFTIFEEQCSQLVATYSAPEVTKILFALKRKQDQFQLDLTAINEWMNYLVLDDNKPCTPSLEKCYDQNSDLLSLKEAWLQGSLDYLNTTFSCKQKEILAKMMAALSFNHPTYEQFLNGVTIEKDYDLLYDFVDTITTYNTKEGELNKIFSDSVYDKRLEGGTPVQQWTHRLYMEAMRCKINCLPIHHVNQLDVYFQKLVLSDKTDFEDIFSLLDNVPLTDNHGSSLIAVLKIVTDYNLDRPTCIKAFELLKATPVQEWEMGIHDLIVRAIFQETYEYTPQELANHIAAKSPHIPFCNNLYAYYQKINELYRSPSTALSHLSLPTASTDETKKKWVKEIKKIQKKSIQQWNKTDLQLWAKCVQGKESTRLLPSKEEMIAVVKRGVEVHYQEKISPRATQLCAVALLLNPGEGKGRLAQINTGEGKSLIVAMLAAIYALQGKKVDVITTSPELSKPEVVKKAPFFSLFNLTVGENSEYATKKVVYEKDIVYGIAGDFQGDILRSEFQGKDIRGKRGFGVVLVDEVDSMLFDKRSQSARIAEGMPAMNYLELTQGAVWNQVNMLRNHLYQPDEDSPYYFIQEDFIVDEAHNISIQGGKKLAQAGEVVKDPIEFIKEKTIAHIQQCFRKLTPEESQEREAYEEANAQMINISKRISHIQGLFDGKAAQLARDNKGDATSLDSQKQEKEKELQATSRKADQLLKKQPTHKQEEAELQHAYNNLEKEKEVISKEITRLEEALIQEVIHKKSKKYRPLYEEKKELEKELKKWEKLLQERGSNWSKRYPILEVPQHLQEFAEHQIPYWVESAMNAKFAYQSKSHYDVHNGGIIPISYRDTGVLQPNMVWSNGLTQFLQIKENLKISPEGVSTNYLSASVFFKRYGTHIYGLTGTIGTKSTQDFFETIYQTDMVTVPPYKHRTILGNEDSPYLCKELPAVIVDDPIKWYDLICNTNIAKAKNKQGVLIICNYINQVKYLADRLKRDYDPTKVFTYTGEIGEVFEKENIHEGEIIVATNIAGRGTDISTSQEVENHGGLHVCVTFLPPSLRVELQNVGRTARQGKKGSAQLIVYDAEKTPIGILKERRDNGEKQAVASAKEDIDKITLQDDLFRDFCAFIREIFPNLVDAQKIKDAATLNKGWEKELEEGVPEALLDNKFDTYIRERCAHALSEVDHETFEKYPVEERDRLRKLKKQKVEVSFIKYKDKERINWKEKMKQNQRDKFCLKFQGRVADDVIDAFRANKPFVIEGQPAYASIEDGAYQRQGLAEQWAIWHHITFAPDKEPSKEEAYQSFEQFKSARRQEAATNSLKKNPAYDTQQGNDNLARGYTVQARDCYLLGIKKNPERSIYNTLNLGHTYVVEKKNRGTLSEAEKCFLTVKRQIDNRDRPELIQLNTLIGQVGNGGQAAVHIKHQLDVLDEVNKHADSALQVIKKAMKANRHVEVVKKATLKELLADADGDHRQAINEAHLNGLTHLWTIKDKKPTPWWSIVGVALIGIAQMASGALISACTGGMAGISWISAGIGDMITAVKSAITGTFNWAAWATQKAISLATSLVCAGISGIKNAISEVKTTASMITNVTEQAVKETVQSGVKDAVKEVAVEFAKSAAKECCYKLADMATDKLFMEDVQKKIEKKVTEQLTTLLSSSDLITRALALDQKNKNNYYQQLIIREGQSILNRHENKFLGALKKIAEGVVANKMNKSGTEKSNSSGTRLLQVVGLQKMLHDLSTLTDDFMRNLEGVMRASYQQAIIDEEKAGQGEEKNRLSTAATGTSYSSQGYQETVAPPPAAHLDSSNLGIHQRGQGGYSSQMHSNVTSLDYTHTTSDKRHLCNAFRGTITGKLVNSVNSNLVNPITHELVDLGVNKLTESLDKGIAARRETRKSGYKYDLGNEENTLQQGNNQDKKEGDTSNNESKEPLNDSAKELINSIEKSKAQDTITTSSIAKSQKCPVHIYKNGKLYKIVGKKLKAKPIELVYDDAQGGHYQPKDGTINFDAQRTLGNNCLLDAVSAVLNSDLKPGSTPYTTNHLKQVVINEIKNNSVTYNNLTTHREHLKKNDPGRLLEGGNPLIWQGIRLGVQAGSAAWTAYKAYKLGKALASDEAMLNQLSKGEYWDATKQAFTHFPYAANIKDGYLALDKGDYNECIRQAQDPVTGIIIAYAGGKAIEKGGKMLIKIAPKALNQLRKFQQGKGQYFNKTQGSAAGASGGRVGSAKPTGGGEVAGSSGVNVSKPPTVTMKAEVTDNIIGGTFKYGDGRITEFFANNKVVGNRLEFTDIAFYPKGAAGNELKNTFGSGAMRETFEAIKNYARSKGFKQVRIKFKRAANSSSAKPGKVFDQIIDLDL